MLPAFKYLIVYDWIWGILVTTLEESVQKGGKKLNEKLQYI